MEGLEWVACTVELLGWAVCRMQHVPAFVCLHMPARRLRLAGTCRNTALALSLTHDHALQRPCPLMQPVCRHSLLATPAPVLVLTTLAALHAILAAAAAAAAAVSLIKGKIPFCWCAGRLTQSFAAPALIKPGTQDLLSNSHLTHTHIAHTAHSGSALRSHTHCTQHPNSVHTHCTRCPPLLRTRTAHSMHAFCSQHARTFAHSMHALLLTACMHFCSQHARTFAHSTHCSQHACLLLTDFTHLSVPHLAHALHTGSMPGYTHIHTHTHERTNMYAHTHYAQHTHLQPSSLSPPPLPPPPPRRRTPPGARPLDSLQRRQPAPPRRPAHCGRGTAPMARVRRARRAGIPLRPLVPAAGRRPPAPAACLIAPA